MKTPPPAFTLRPWTMDDLDNLVRFANTKRIADNLADAFPHPYTPEDGIVFVHAGNSDGSQPHAVSQLPGRVFAIVVEEVACGCIGFYPQADVHRKNAEIGYWLAEEYQGRGIMTEAVKQVIRYVFSTYDICRIFASTFATNRASQRVLEKAGMHLEARLHQSICKNGQVLDELIYSVVAAG